jgi:hypothetical protein
MRRGMFTGACLVVVGAIWVGQGLGLVRGSSFMVDEPFWAVVGALAVVTGVVIALLSIRRSRRV